MIILIILIILLFGGGWFGFNQWGPRGGISLGTLLLIVLIIYLLVGYR
jgi:hypothetical protein